MTGVSHAITGALIAVVVKEPAIALPAALLSHFVCDMVPHVGTKDIKDKSKRRTLSHRIYKIDLALILIFFAGLFMLNAPEVVIASAFLAGSPDFVWFYRYIIKEQIQKINPGPMNVLSRFHSRIQRSETLKAGVPIEIVYSSCLLFVVINQL